MRAFLAVVPPPEVVETLESFLEPRRDALAASGQWRWTRTEHLHLTLAFLPELEEWREEELGAEGERWAARHTPESLALAGAGAFPDPGSARVLWAGVEEERDGTLAGWAKDLRAIASRVGAQVQGTRFSPHVTLARARGRPHPAGHLLQSLDTLRTPPWSADEVALIASFLGQGPGGTPRYEVRATWRLGRPLTAAW
jgi:2'-5' RNA ligase